MNQEKGLCLEPAGPLEGQCVFYDVGVDYKQALRLVECVEGSIQQQWIFEKTREAQEGEHQFIRSAENPAYCITVPPPFYREGHHDEYEVWLCECDNQPRYTFVKDFVIRDSGDIAYWNDAGSYLIGFGTDKHVNERTGQSMEKQEKMTLCYDADGDGNGPSFDCGGTHWLSAGADNNEGPASSLSIVV